MPPAPATIRSSLNVAFTEERQLQSLHFPLEFKKLHKRALIFLFIVGLGGIFKRWIVSDRQHL